MDINHKIKNEVCIVAINGNMAMDSIADIKHYIALILDDESLIGLIINFKNVRFIDSSGLGLIISTFKTLQQRDAKFAIFQLNESNTEIFKMTRLGIIVTIVETEEEALSIFAENEK